MTHAAALLLFFRGFLRAAKREKEAWRRLSIQRCFSILGLIGSEQAAPPRLSLWPAEQPQGPVVGQERC